MTIVDRPRLQYTIDATDPYQVYSFVEDFRDYLHGAGHEYEARMFEALIANYTAKVDPENMHFGDILTIASQFAEIVETSGTDLSENIFLKDYDGTGAEQVLAELEEETSGEDHREHESDDGPLEIVPFFPNVLVEITRSDTLESLVDKAFTGLTLEGYPHAVNRLAAELRELLRSHPRNLDLIRLVRHYVTVEAVE